MHHQARLLAAAGVALAAVLSGCGASHYAPIPPPARLERAPGSTTTRIVLSAVGAQRIGLQTAQAQGIRLPAPTVTTRLGASGMRHKVLIRRSLNGPTVTIPYSAVIYDPSGRTYAFVASSRLTFTEVPIRIDRIDGGSAYLLKGPRPGSHVVSIGAEELYGVQTGVLGQT